MDKEKALDKIKKCLALSRSANEYEAAQALKHAQALMAQYGVSESDVALADVSECKRKAPKTVPEWHWRLVHLCGRAFGCERWHATDFSGGSFVFCGLGGRAELAAYAYEVLLRQLKAARRQYIKTALSRVCDSRIKTARADKFCEGWVSRVKSVVQDFARTDAEKELLEHYQTNKYGQFGVAKTRDVKAPFLGFVDYQVGRGVAAGVRLDVPLGREQQAQIGAKP